MKAAVPRRSRRVVALAVASLALAAGAAGAQRQSADAGSPCTTASGLPGTIVVWTDSSGVVKSWCQYAPPSEALPALVLNEIDYDQVGADAGGFVELYNAGLSPADLEGLALVFVDGANGMEYRRRPLRGITFRPMPQWESSTSSTSPPSPSRPRTRRARSSFPYLAGCLSSVAPSNGRDAQRRSITRASSSSTLSSCPGR